MTPEPLELSVIPAETLARLRDGWNSSTNLPARGLLRLDLLRGLVRAVHAERSRCLATGKREAAAFLKTWEKRLEDLRQLGPLEGELDALLVGAAGGPLLKKKSRLPPQALLATLGADRLNRYDRQWEAALSSEACSVGWKFWGLDAWVEIPRAEEWNTRLAASLWPTGIVLFVETAQSQGQAHPQPPSNMSRTSGSVPLPLWSGHWTVALRPDLIDLSAVLEDVRKWPGYPAAPPDPPRWKLLFAPKSA